MERQELQEAFLAAFLEGAGKKDIERLNIRFFRFILPWIVNPVRNNPPPLYGKVTS